MTGCSESDGHDFLGALANVQAVWLNSEELDKADWLMDEKTIRRLKQNVMAEALPQMKGIKRVLLNMEGGAELCEQLGRARPQVAKFNALCGQNGKCATAMHGPRPACGRTRGKIRSC